MLRLTQKGQTVLKTIKELSEKDIRLLGFIAYEKTAFEKSVEGAEWVGYALPELQQLQRLGYIKGEQMIKLKEDNMTKDEAFKEYEETLAKIDKQARDASEEARTKLREQLKTLCEASHEELKAIHVIEQKTKRCK